MHRVAVSERINTRESTLLHCKMLYEYRTCELVMVVIVMVALIRLLWLLRPSWHVREAGAVCVMLMRFPLCLLKCISVFQVGLISYDSEPPHWMWSPSPLHFPLHFSCCANDGTGGQCFDNFPASPVFTNIIICRGDPKCHLPFPGKEKKWLLAISFI